MESAFTKANISQVALFPWGGISCTNLLIPSSCFQEKPETSIQMFLKQTNLEKPIHRTYPGVHAIGLDFQRHLLTTSPSYNRTNSELYRLPLSTLYGWLCAYGCSWNCWKAIFICSLFTIHSLPMLVPYCLHSAQTYFSLLFCADLIS